MAKLRRLNAFTLIETLISMTILLIVTGIGFMLFYKVTQQETVGIRLQASLMVKKYSDSTINYGQYTNDTWNVGVLHLKRSAEEYPGHPNVLALDFTAFSDSGGLIAEERRLVLKDINEKN